MRKWNRRTAEFKKQAVERMKGCDNIAALAQELGVQRKLLYIWKEQLERGPGPVGAGLAEGPDKREENKLREENGKLKAALGMKALEVDFFRGALRRFGEGRQSSGCSGAGASTPKSE